MADLGLDLYNENEYIETEFEIEGDTLFQAQDIDEDKFLDNKPPPLPEKDINGDIIFDGKELPPLPEPTAEEELAFSQTKFKYTEDTEFLNLCDVPALEKLFLCVSANAYPRRMWICHQMPQLLKELTIEQAFAYVFPLTMRLCQDDILSVCEALVENLDDILLYFYEPTKTEDLNKEEEKEIPKLDAESVTQLLGFTLFSLEPSINEIAETSIISLGQKVSLDVLEKELLPMFIQLLMFDPNVPLHEDSFDPYQYILMDRTAVKLKILKVLRNLYPICKVQTLNEVILPTLENLVNDQRFEVRRELATSIQNLFPLMISKTLVDRLYPLFESLASDKVYDVRQEACELLVHISETLILEGYGPQCITWMETFLKDSSVKVQNKANFLLGRFLFLFNGREMPEPLLKKFFSNCKSSYPEVRYGTAYHFPAIVLLLDSKGWDQVKPHYVTLAKDSFLPIVRSIAASIHEVAKILTKQQVLKDLIPIYDSFLTHDEHEVRLIVLNTCSEFFKRVDENYRPNLLKSLLSTFSDFLLQSSSELKDWRMKETLINELKELIDLVTPTFAIQSLLPLLLMVAKANSAVAVKEWVIELMPLFYQKVNSKECDDTSLLVYLFDQINSLKISNSFQYRQLYVMICHKMYTYYSNEDVFDQFFLPNLSRLVQDPVYDVRFKVAKLLNEVNLDVEKGKKEYDRKLRKKIAAVLSCQFKEDEPQEILKLISDIKKVEISS